MNRNTRSARLSHLELAAVDLSITALQAAGHTIGETETSSNPHEMMAEAVLAAHQPFIELGERDREIIEQIKDLAGQLSVQTSLADLVKARGEVIQSQ